MPNHIPSAILSRKETERRNKPLVLIGVLTKINNSEWECPLFTMAKPDGSLQSLADLREVNKRLSRENHTHYKKS
jgi:hypothetical protein